MPVACGAAQTSDTRGNAHVSRGAAPGVCGVPALHPSLGCRCAAARPAAAAPRAAAQGAAAVQAPAATTASAAPHTSASAPAARPAASAAAQSGGLAPAGTPCMRSAPDQRARRRKAEGLTREGRRVLGRRRLHRPIYLRRRLLAGLLSIGVLARLCRCRPGRPLAACARPCRSARARACSRQAARDGPARTPACRPVAVAVSVCPAARSPPLAPPLARGACAGLSPDLDYFGPVLLRPVLVPLQPATGLKEAANLTKLPSSLPPGAAGPTFFFLSFLLWTWQYGSARGSPR